MKYKLFYEINGRKEARYIEADNEEQAKYKLRGKVTGSVKIMKVRLAHREPEMQKNFMSDFMDKVFGKGKY